MENNHCKALIALGLLILSAALSTRSVVSYQCSSIWQQQRHAFTSLHAAATKKRTSPKEVTQMFNDYADHFEDKLVKTLNYSAPLEVARAASKRIFNETGDVDGDGRQGRLYTSALDAGCGTGLMGVHLRNLVNGPLIGVDLSPKMAEFAAELVMDEQIMTESNKNRTMPQQLRRSTESARLALGGARVYDGVFLADLLDLSSSAKTLPDAVSEYGHTITKFPTNPYDLIAAADVLCYFGEMETVLKAFAQILVPGGDLVFSTETMAVGDYNWIMLPSERYAHDAKYVARMADKAGLIAVSQTPFTPRLELGEEVLGTLHIFHKPLQLE